MDSDNDEEKYYISEDMEDDAPRPPSRQSSISEPPSPDFSASSSEDEDGAPTLPVDTAPSTPKTCSLQLYWGSQWEKQGNWTRNE